MHRVELKGGNSRKIRSYKEEFLMHRVELKGKRSKKIRTTLLYTVPNVPCGVESTLPNACTTATARVPNVPCGVERNPYKVLKPKITKFLMHRVELKGIHQNMEGTQVHNPFLMHRVELKKSCQKMPNFCVL